MVYPLIAIASIKMTIRRCGQFTSEMHRRIIFALLVHGLLATCFCTVLRRNVDAYQISRPRSVQCNQDGDSRECETRGIRRIEEQRNNRTEAKVARMFGDGMPRDEGFETSEVATSRKKKDKRYGQMLWHFLGAAKLTMLYVIINTVAAVAAKALIAAKVALAIATAIALKKASEHQEKVSYEIVKHPYPTYEHTHSSSIDYDHHGFGENDYTYRKRRKVYQQKV